VIPPTSAPMNAASTLKVSPNGSKLWRLKYYAGGKEKRIALGAWPEVSLQAARLERDELRLRIAKGEDPALTRKKNKATAKISAANTFELVAREDIETKMVGEGRAEATLLKARWLPRSAQTSDRAHADFGCRSANDARPAKKLEARGNRETAKKCRSFASRVFRYGAATGRCTTDPTAILKGAPPHAGSPLCGDPRAREAGRAAARYRCVRMLPDHQACAESCTARVRAPGRDAAWRVAGDRLREGDLDDPSR